MWHDNGYIFLKFGTQYLFGNHDRLAEVIQDLQDIFRLEYFLEITRITWI